MIKIISEESIGSQLLTFFKLSFLIYTIKCPEKNINIISHSIFWRSCLEKAFFGEAVFWRSCFTPYHIWCFYFTHNSSFTKRLTLEKRVLFH